MHAYFRENKLVLWLALGFAFAFVLIGRPVVVGDGWGYFGIYRSVTEEGSVRTSDTTQFTDYAGWTYGVLPEAVRTQPGEVPRCITTLLLCCQPR